MTANGPGRSPMQWLLHTSLLILFIAIALNIGISLIQEVWGWIVGIAILAGIIWAGITVWRARGNQW